MDVCKAIAKETAKDIHDAQHRVPSRIPVGLLRAAIPHLNQRDERRGNRGFERAQHKSGRHQTSKIRRCGHSTEGRSPTEHHDCNELSKGKLDEEVSDERLLQAGKQVSRCLKQRGRNQSRLAIIIVCSMWQASDLLEADSLTQTN